MTRWGLKIWREIQEFANDRVNKFERDRNSIERHDLHIMIDGLLYLLARIIWALHRHNKHDLDEMVDHTHAALVEKVSDFAAEAHEEDSLP